MRYRKKPIILDLHQFTNEPGEDFPDWFSAAVDDGRITLSEVRGEPGASNTVTLAIKTLEGVMTANIGDFIAKGVVGELYPIAESLVPKLYDRIVEDNVEHPNACVVERCKHLATRKLLIGALGGDQDIPICAKHYDDVYAAQGDKGKEEPEA
jgi:hypothetical protein